LHARSIATTQIPIGPNIPPASNESPLSGDHIAYFGLPTHSKGIVDLLDAIARIDPLHRPAVTLVGASGNASTSNDIVPLHVLERIARLRRIDINCTGFLSPHLVAAELSVARAIVLPFRDGASLRSGSLLAALQSGRPVVTTRPARTEDLCSLLALRQLRFVPMGDPGALAVAIASVDQHPMLADTLPTEFTWPSIAARHLELYRSVLEAHRS
jgi:glycosyltransferase involved in cell wall biosynthesis